MNYYKISTEQKLEKVDSIWGMLSDDKRKIYYLVDDATTTVHYPKPPKSDDIQSISIRKNGSKANIDIKSSIAYKLAGLDAKKYSKQHFDLLREFHNEVAVNNMMKKISTDGYLTYPDTEVVRVLTEDNKVYAIYQGVIFLIGLTLRMTRVFGNITNPNIKQVQAGVYEAKNGNFSFEKLSCKKRDYLPDKSIFV